MAPRLLAAGARAEDDGPTRRDRQKVQILQRAAMYQELEAHPAFRDFAAHLQLWRTQLLEDLRWGHLRRGRAFGTSDDDVRAMLYMLGLVLDIPAGAKAAYEVVRKMDEEAARARERAEQRLGVSLEAE